MAIIYDTNKKILSQNTLQHIKLDAMREILPKEMVIIDPESEYENLAKQLGGEMIRLEKVTPSHINPLDSEVKNIKKYICKEDFIINDVFVGHKGDVLKVTDATPNENETTEDVAGYCDILNITTNEQFEATWMDIDETILVTSVFDALDEFSTIRT